MTERERVAHELARACAEHTALSRQLAEAFRRVVTLTAKMERLLDKEAEQVTA